MKEVVALLIDLGAGGSLSDSIRQILASAKDRRFTILEEPLRGDSSSSGRRAIFTPSNPDVILLILASNSHEWARAIVREAAAEGLNAPILVISEDRFEGEVAELLALGAADFVIAPLRSADLLPRIGRFLRRKSSEESIVQRLKEELGLGGLIGESPVFRLETRKIPIVAKSDATILISGETGTGKELCARAIHYVSPRNGKPFVGVNCGALPVELVENELFGHVRGAFTGANSSEEGLIHEADDGTLFLDEIDCLPALAQAKFLRFLQDREYKQLGSKSIRHANVRIIAATNINLEEAVREGKFRQDLFYRLNIIPLALPTLRARHEDIPLLAGHFLEKYNLEFNKAVADFGADAMQMLVLYQWPGNVRELESVVERAVIFCEGSIVRSSDIVFQVRPEPQSQTWSFRKAKAEAIEHFERGYIEQLLLGQKGNITKAAEVAGKNRRAFWELIRRHKIDVQRYKSDLPQTG